MSSSNLKQYYMNDVALLQFSTLYISLLLFNEVSTNLSSEKDLNDATDILTQLFELIESLKEDGQKSQILKFISEIMKMSKYKNNSFKCIKDFISQYLPEDNSYDNLKYLLELKVFPGTFKKECENYEKNKNNEKYNNILGILENIIQSFKNYFCMNEKMNLSYMNIFSNKKMKDRSELEKDINDLLSKIKEINIEKNRLLTNKNAKLKNANVKIFQLQENEKQLKKNSKEIKRENDSLKREKKELNSKFELMMKRIDELEKNVEELIKSNNAMEMNLKEKDSIIEKLINNDQDLEEKNTNLKQEITDLTKKINSLEYQNIYLLELNNMQRAEIDNLNNNYDYLYSILEDCFGVRL